MSPASPVPWLLDLVFMGLLAGGLREPWLWSAAAVALWAVAAAHPPRRGSVSPLWAAWLGWALMSALACAEPLWSLAAFARTAAPVIAFALVSGRFDEGGRQGLSARMGLAGGLLGLSAVFIQRPGFAFAGLLYPQLNYTGCVLSCVFASSLAAALWKPQSPERAVQPCAEGAAALHPSFSTWGRKGRVLLLAASGFCLALIAVMRSRGALWACAFAALVVLLRRRCVKILAIGLLCGSAALAFAPGEAVVHLLKLDLPSAPVRPRIWQAALAVAAEHPLLGEGPGRFGRGFLRHNFPAPAGFGTRYGLATEHAHSEILEAAAETGFVGLGLFLLALGAALLGALRRSPQEGWGREAALAAFCAIFAHSLVDSVFALPGLALLYFGLLGACVQEAPPSDRAEPRAGRKAAWAAFCAAGCLLSALAWWPRWAVSRCAARSMEGPEEAQACALEALRIAPEDAALWENLARVRLKAGRPGALTALAESSRLSPTNAVYRLARADLLLALGDAEAASLEAAQAAALEPRSPQARLLLAQALVRMGRPDAARAALSEAVRLRGRVTELDRSNAYEVLMLGLDPGGAQALSRALKGMP